MSHGSLPRTDDALRVWAQNLAGTLDTEYAAFGVSQEMAEQFRVVTDAYAAAMVTATAPLTRTRPSVAGKNDAREALKVAARSVVAIVRAHPGVTEQQKLELGLTIPATTRTRIAPPDHAPVIRVISVRGNTVTVRLLDATVTRRGRPDKVKAALVFSAVGDQPPTQSNTWKLAANSSKTTFNIVFDSSVAPGAMVWLTAQWLSPTAAAGPSSAAVSTRIQGGGIEGLGMMRVAA